MVWIDGEEWYQTEIDKVTTTRKIMAGNRPIEIKHAKKKTIKVLIWDNGGKTLVRSIPPKKDDPEGAWKDEKINFKFREDAQAMIEVLQEWLKADIASEEARGIGGVDF